MTTTLTPRRLGLLALVLTLGVPLAGHAQTNSQMASGLQFDFPLPGARSLALGGAFVAVADDATAAVANPAGLTALLRPEVSFEGRRWRYVTVTPYEGHAGGNPTGTGIDTVSGVVNRESAASASGPSFVSGVFPRGRLAIGVYRHEQAKFRSDIASNGIFYNFQNGYQDRLPGFTGDMKLDIANYGGSLAYRFAGGFSIGGGVALSDFAIDSRVAVFYRSPPDGSQVQAPAQRALFTGAGQLYGPTDFSAGNTWATIVESGEDQGVAFNVGALYRRPDNRWSAGAAIRRNPAFQYSERAAWGPKGPLVGQPQGTEISTHTVEFKVPDVYSAGASFRATDRFLVTGQIDQVLFSQLSRNLKNVNSNTLPPPDGLEVANATITRFGAEYALVTGGRVVSFRMGTAHEPEHQLAYSLPDSVNLLAAVTYPEGKTQWHVTPGVGVAFGNIQFDAAVDRSPRVTTISVSAVYRF